MLIKMIKTTPLFVEVPKVDRSTVDPPNITADKKVMI